LNSPVEYGGGDNIIAGLMGSNCGIEYLRALIRYGADINHENDYGKTALHKAAQDKNENNVRVLIELGADKSIIDYQKSTPKDYWPEMFIKLESEELLNSLHGEITGGMGKRRM
jgi:ankyrin repeat protein